MDEIEIFIAQSLEGPRKGDGSYIYLLQKKGNDKTLTDWGEKEECTAHILEIDAVITALKRLRRPCSIEIHSAHGWITQIYQNQWLKKWREASWLNSKGKEVANASQLRELSAIIEEGGHNIVNVDSDLRNYTSWMEFAIEKQEERKRDGRKNN